MARGRPVCGGIEDRVQGARAYRASDVGLNAATVGPTGIAGALLRLNHQAGNRAVGALIDGRASLPALRVQRQALGLGALGIETDLDNEPVDSTPVEAMSYSQVRDELHKYERWLAKQTQSNPKSAAIEQRRDTLSARLKHLEGVPKSHGRDQKHQAPRPRSLSEDLDPRSMSRQDVNAELDAISTYLATGPPAAEIKKLGLARLLLDDAVAADDRVRDEAVRGNDITVALAAAPGSGEQQMRETLAVIEGISADPDRRGVWLLHSGRGMVIPVAEAELKGVKAGVSEQLSGIAHELTKVMTQVWQDWESDEERAHQHKIVHALSSWTSGADDPGDMARMQQVAIGLRNQIDVMLQAGQFREALTRIETLQRMVEYEAKKVGKWEDDLSHGAGRWVTALTVMKDGLAILATAGAAAATAGMVEAGSSLVGATATVTAGTTLAGTGGAVVGSLADQAMDGDVSLVRTLTAARTGGQQGLVIGASGGVGSAAKRIFGAGEAVGTASKIIRTVGAGATASTTVNVAGALVGGTSIKGAALSGGVGGSISAFGGNAINALTNAPALSTLGQGVVGAASGIAAASVSDGSLVEGGLAGAAGSVYNTVNQQLYEPQPTELATAAAGPADRIDPQIPTAQVKMVFLPGPKGVPAGGGEAMEAAFGGRVLAGDDEGAPVVAGDDKDAAIVAENRASWIELTKDAPAAAQRIHVDGENLASSSELTLIDHGAAKGGLAGGTRGAEQIALSGVGRVGPNTLAEMLVQQGWAGGYLRLLSCGTGVESRSGLVFGEQLSIALAQRGAPTVVAAPVGLVQVGSVFGPGPVVASPRVLIGVNAFGYW